MMGKKIIPSCIPYPGSKKKMLEDYRIHEFIPKINHDHLYVELFCGSAVMFFNLEAEYMYAYINDLRGELINFWRVIATHYTEFYEKLQYMWPGMSFKPGSKVEEAVMFYVSNSISSHITKPVHLRKDLRIWKSKLDKARLWIDNRPFEEEMEYLMKLYTSNVEERPIRLLFYEDPPYWGSESVYKKNRKDQTVTPLPPFDHQLLHEKNTEAKEKGHFILLSYNDCPEIRALYPESEGWYLKSFKYKPNGMQAKRALNRDELLISNEPLVRRNNKKLTEFL